MTHMKENVSVYGYMDQLEQVNPDMLINSNHNLEKIQTNGGMDIQTKTQSSLMTWITRPLDTT